MSETEQNIIENKKDWEAPSLITIPFTNTKGGEASYVEEDWGGTVKTIS